MNIAWDREDWSFMFVDAVVRLSAPDFRVSRVCSDVDTCLVLMLTR